MKRVGIFTSLLFVAIWTMTVRTADRVIEADLLVVGGSDSATPAAAQAARMGVKHIVVVNDIQWFGGQWGPGGLSGTMDELTQYRGRHAIFPRSGTELEIAREIREYNRRTFGMGSPGARALTSTPMGGAQAFFSLIKPYLTEGTGQIEVFWPYQPVAVALTGNRVTGVTFENPQDPQDRLVVNARMTIDASDWGDVIRRSGAEYFVGPDPKPRFGEVGAPEEPLGALKNELNSFSWTVVVTEAGHDATIPKPPGYDERFYYHATRVTADEFKKLDWKGMPPGTGLPFVDMTALGGTVPDGGDSFYTHRRAVDRRHNPLLPGVKDIVVISWRPTEDYPLYNFPKTLVDALEADERGASQKNFVEMTYKQRQLVYEDAKRYELGFLYFLQTKAHEKTGDYPESFKYMELFDEFGTADKLPPKPYIREGLRLHALYVVRRQDVDSGKRGDSGFNWARAMYPDIVASWQNWFDLHNSRRVFLHDDPTQPWMARPRAGFQTTDSDRAGFPLRGLVPVKRDGLIGSFLNIGNSSIVNGAVRWNTNMPRIGQASGALAAIALREDVQPRNVASNWKWIREVQKSLVMPPEGSPGAALWAYQDLQAEGDLELDYLFQSANMLAVRAILPGRKGTLDFEPYGTVTRRELAGVMARAARSLEGARPYYRSASPIFSDVSPSDPDRTYIESLVHWGVMPPVARFQPDDPADSQTLAAWMKALGLTPKGRLEAGGEEGGGRRTSPVLYRWDLSVQLWAAMKDLPEYFPAVPGYLIPGHDSDGDGISDLDDALPLDRNNDNIPDWLDPTNVHND